MKLLSKLWNMIRPLTQREEEEKYLSEAKDLADLERRMKRLQNSNLSGWV